MQPYQHIAAKGNEGALTLASKNPDEKLVVLGASCITSATLEDGLVGSFSLVPSRAKEALVVAVVRLSKKTISDAFILGVDSSEGKAVIDLCVPFACSPKAIAQLMVTANSCQIRVIQQKNSLRLSRKWERDGENENDGGTWKLSETGEDFNVLCNALVEK